MTTLERMLAEFTPLPTDVIKYCVQPYITRPRQWRNTFANVLADVEMLKWFISEDRNITSEDMFVVGARNPEIVEFLENRRLGHIEY